MAALKRRTLTLSSGKQLKLYGNSMAIGASLEIGEGSAPNIFSFIEQQPEEKTSNELTAVSQDGKPVKETAAKKSSVIVSNPHRLTRDEIVEMADYNMRLWMDLKDNIRKYGLNSIKVFNSDALK